MGKRISLFSRTRRVKVHSLFRGGIYLHTINYCRKYWGNIFCSRSGRRVLHPLLGRKNYSELEWDPLCISSCVLLPRWNERRPEQSCFLGPSRKKGQKGKQANRDHRTVSQKKSCWVSIFQFWTTLFETAVPPLDVRCREKTVRGQSIDWLNYTHFWRESAWTWSGTISQ